MCAKDLNVHITIFTYDAQHRKRDLMSCSNSKCADQHAHSCSLTWVFSVHRHIPEYPLIM